MGLGDPYHKHPLRNVRSPASSNCFHCELPLSDGFCFGCPGCDYYIHDSCQDLPIKLRLPVHDEHLLTRYEPPPNSSNSLCNVCESPCLGRFSYHCTTCQFYFHLKCLSTFKHEKHDHPLIFATNTATKFREFSCKICGTYIHGFAFGCRSCEFYIHHQCGLIPLEVKRHHVHELALRHNFPKECDQVYCDLCEDKDGELNRTLSHYYCKRCDYIAHVKCCITKPMEDVLLSERFTHEHPLMPNKRWFSSCSQCSYGVDDYTDEYPSLVKHPDHPHHTLVVDQKEHGDFNCTECHFTMNRDTFVKFTHPLWKYDLRFVCKNSRFRCDACGELGKGSRVEYYIRQFVDGFDLHLECFALPGKLDHESHPNHPLYLRWLDKSTSRNCSVCTKEMDPRLWFYFCQECDYAAHMDCVARDLLLTNRSFIKNQPDFCAIIAPDESSFKYRIADMRPFFSRPSRSKYIPVLEVYGDDDEGNYDVGTDSVGNVLACPKCSSVISTQTGYSTIKEWKSGFHKNSTIMTANDQTTSESEPLSLLEEQTIDELCCSICNMLIFTPTYSCASCQLYFHKSCAELPRKILFKDTTYVLMAPPFPEGLSDCNECKYPISNWAYVSLVGGFIFDVLCASGGPLVNRTHYNHNVLFLRAEYDFECRACDNDVKMGMFTMMSGESQFFGHLECGLLPPVVTNHRIHWHPLELATDLAELYDEYVCDVCEKDLNPNLWAYRCVDECGIRATSHVSCVITSKKKCHFSYEKECQNMTEEEKLAFRRKTKNQVRG